MIKIILIVLYLINVFFAIRNLYNVNKLKSFASDKNGNSALHCIYQSYFESDYAKQINEVYPEITGINQEMAFMYIYGVSSAYLALVPILHLIYLAPTNMNLRDTIQKKDWNVLIEEKLHLTKEKN